MHTDLSNRNNQRWPVLEEYGPMLIDAGQRRTTVRKPRTVVGIDNRPERGDEGETPRGNDERLDEHLIHGNRTEPADHWELHIVQQPFIELMTYFWSRQPEAGGVLFGPVDDAPLVTRFIPDHLGRGTPVAFELHTPSLNQMLQEFKAAGLTLKGIVHSHPCGITQPSGGDLTYFRRLFAWPANAGTTHVFVPIICGGRFYPYVYTGHGVAPATLVVV